MVALMYFSLMTTLAVMMGLSPGNDDLHLIGDKPISDLNDYDVELAPDFSPNGDQPPWQLGQMLEGDMLLSRKQHEQLLHGLFSKDQAWPTTRVPIYIDNKFTYTEKNTIMEALNEFSKYTCVSFDKSTDDDEDYVWITNFRRGCHSHVGYVGQAQQVNLDPRVCLKKGTIIHEMLHTLGFRHEHSALDRDDYITIHLENVMEGKRTQFKKYNASLSTSFGITYDYDSVMHYSEYAFTKNGLRTIVPKDENANIGQREGFSAGDILKINRLYNCTQLLLETAT